MNNTSLQTVSYMTSQLNYSQENIQTKESQLTVVYTNNRPLFILAVCLFIILICVLLSWYIKARLSKRNSLNKVFVTEDFDFTREERLLNEVWELKAWRIDPKTIFTFRWCFLLTFILLYVSIKYRCGN